MIRTAIVAVALHGLLPQAHAQVDINALLQQGGANVQLVPDTDPYVPNAFVGSFTMELHAFEDGKAVKEAPMNIAISSSVDKLLFRTTAPGMKDQVHILIDQKDKWQYMLMTDGAGNRIAMKTRKMKVITGEDKNPNAADVLVTDGTKIIDGHLCKKMTAKTEDGTWTGWLAQDIDVPFHSFMRDMRRTGTGFHDDALVGIHGFPLEYEWTSTDGKERMQCFIRDLQQGKVDEKAFSLDGYQVLELPVRR